MWQSLEIFNVLNFLTLKRILWKANTFFKRLGYHFLVESTKIENATFPYKTAQSNVKKNAMGSTKLTYHKERTFANNFTLLIILFFKNFILV